MSQPHPVSKEKNGGQESLDRATSKPGRSVGSRLFKGVMLLGLVGVVVVMLQRFLVPDVDLEKTAPVVVGVSATGTESAKSEPGKSSLPEGAVTVIVTQADIDQADHPFRPLIAVADSCLKEIDGNIRDYTATLVSQVFVDNRLQEEKYLECKIRHAHSHNGKQVPFSVYTKFLKPKANVGQEAIWVQGKNDGNLVAHATGLLNVKRVFLDPDGAMAMKGNRYPIRDIGFRNLIVKMSEAAQKDVQHGECTVTIKRDIDINGCKCTLFEAVHPVPRDHFDFHIARIYIDDQRNIPVAFEGYLWPEKEGQDPPLLEKYYYTNVKLNVGLTDEDFDPNNKEYDYPSW